jgi:hypothetical protein
MVLIKGPAPLINENWEGELKKGVSFPNSSADLLLFPAFGLFLGLCLFLGFWHCGSTPPTRFILLFVFCKIIIDFCL